MDVREPAVRDPILISESCSLIMIQRMLISTDFWIELERKVTAKVDSALNTDDAPRDLLISYLRDVEIMARAACERRQTIQIIASGRSLLGDREPLGPQDGPFAYAVA